MAVCCRSLHRCLAPFFVVYTVLVTYFLLQTAWDDVSSRHKRGGDVNILDDLVREERRHLRSFQNVMETFREQTYFTTGNSIKEYSVQGQQDIDPSTGHLAQATNVLSLDDPDQATLHDSLLPKVYSEGRPLPEHVPAPAKVFQVEVEEWDSNVPAAATPLNQETPHHFLQFPTQKLIPDHRLKGVGQNFIRPDRGINVTRHTNYTADFCDNVFREVSPWPPICQRQLVVRGTRGHLSLSTSSLLFRPLGDLFLYSAFLDTRSQTQLIRLMTLGPGSRGNSKSIYWCVFLLRSPAPEDPAASNQSMVDPENSLRHATQLTYYAASDGHNKSRQFYIMSCPVPDWARPGLLPPHRGVFQVIAGDLHRPFLPTYQDSLMVKVIRNLSPEGKHSPYKENIHNKKIEVDRVPEKIRTFPESLIVSTQHPGVHYSANDNGTYLSRVNHSGGDTITTPQVGDPLTTPQVGDPLTTPQVRDPLTTPQVDDPLTTPQVVHSFGDRVVTCVAPLNLTSGVVQLVEFLELTLLLGTQHVVFYILQVSDEVQQVLRLYQDRGLVSVLPWHLPDPDSVWASGRDMALNDCLYRTMHLYHQGLFLDLDEFLVPRVTSDIPSFLRYLATVHKLNPAKISDLVISSAYFPPPTKSQFKNLSSIPEFSRDVTKFSSLRSVYRTYFNPKHTVRLITLDKAIRVGPGERKRTSFVISSRYAVVHHYSHCPFSVGSPTSQKGQAEASFCSHKKQDLIMWRYQAVLVSRVKESFRRIHGG